MTSFSEKMSVVAFCLFVLSSILTFVSYNFGMMALFYGNGLSTLFFMILHFSSLGSAILGQLKQRNARKPTFRLPPDDCD